MRYVLLAPAFMAGVGLWVMGGGLFLEIIGAEAAIKNVLALIEFLRTFTNS